jgi:4-amino-4-deoxy-L-arabinose transferase-like glycosyltransferase
VCATLGVWVNTDKASAFTTIDWTLAILLSVLAAIPRLSYLDLAEFKLDEATHYLMAHELTRGHWTWVGSVSSMGIPKPPLLVYVLALPMRLSHDPRVVTGFLGMLGALAVGGSYLLLRRFLGRGAALAGGLLFAVNVQAILYSRKLFTADLIPPLTALLLAVSLRFVDAERKHASRWACLTAFAFSLLLLVTFSPALLFPALAFLFWQERGKLTASGWVGAALAFGLPLAPYLLHITAQLAAAADHVGELAEARPAVFDWLWTLLAGTPWRSDGRGLALVTALTTALLAACGVVWLVDEARKGTGAPRARFLLSWLLLTPMMAMAVPIEVESHYLVCMYPVLFVLPAAGIHLLYRITPKLGRAALVLVAVSVLWQARVWVTNLQAIQRGVEGYGTPLGYWWKAAEEARQLATQHAVDEVLLLLPGDHPWDEKAHILSALLADTPHRVVDGRLTVVYPAHPAVLLIASEAGEAGELVAPCTMDIAPRLTASPFGGTYAYRLWGGGAPEGACGMELQLAPAQWASGAQLLGYRLAGSGRPGETLQVTLHWQTNRGPLDEDVHWFDVIVDQQGNVVGQFDHAGWPSSQWEPGDQVVTYFALTIDAQASAGPYTLRIGQYTYPAMENIPVLDAAGNPAQAALQFTVPAP